MRQVWLLHIHTPTDVRQVLHYDRKEAQEHATRERQRGSIVRVLPLLESSAGTLVMGNDTDT